MGAQTQNQNGGARAVKWAMLDRFSGQLIQLISTLVLARLLSPKDFGLVGILYIFLSVSSALVDSGMAGGLIRKKELSEQDTSTFFFFNITTAFFCYGCIFFTAPMIARFYGEPSLLGLSRLLSLAIITSSLGLLQRVLLIRSLKLKQVTRASLYSSLAATFLGMGCAWAGLGIYSLVIMLLTQSSINTLLLALATRWRPAWTFSWQSLREFFSFGFSLMLTALLNIGFANIYQPLIGRYYSLSYAGFYYQAKRLYEVPILSLSQVVDSVSYPILVRYQQDRKGLELRYRQIFSSLIFLAAPLVVLISVLSEDIVRLLLGEKWLFSAHLLSILSLGGIFQVLETTSGSLLKVEGRTKLIFRLELIKKGVILMSILSVYALGIAALMWAIVLSSVLSFIINQCFTSIRPLGYGSLFLVLINAGCMGVVAKFASGLLAVPALSISFTLGVSLGCYALLGHLFNLPEQKIVRSMIQWPKSWRKSPLPL